MAARLTAGDVYRPIGDESGEAILVIRAPMPELGWPAALTAACALVAAVACLLATYRIVRLEPWVILSNDFS